MLQHLEFLFGRALAGQIEVTGIHTDKDARHAPRTRFFDCNDYDAAADFASAVNGEPGWNVYVGAALRNDDVFPGKAADDGDFLKTYAVWADADDGDQLAYAREQYRSLGVTPPLVVVTGRTPSKRAQLWWPLETPIDDIDTLRSLLRGIAGVLKTDPKVCTGKQLMRLAGGVNWPKKQDRILERTEIAQPPRALREFEMAHLSRVFPPMERAALSTITADVQISHGGALGLEERVMDGREGYAFNLVRAHLHEFIGSNGAEPTADELYRSVAPVYLKKVDQVRPGRGPEFLKQKCAEALRAFEAGQIPFMRNLEEAVQTYAGRQRREAPSSSDGADRAPTSDDDADLFEVLTVGDLKRLPPADWIIKDAIPRGGLGFVYGAPGSYKSFICYDLALAMAHGHGEWIGRAVKHGGSVLYLASEGSQGAKTRIEAWQQKNGVTEDTDAFRLIRKSMSFMEPEDVDRLERTVAAIVQQSGPVDTIFVDTVSRVLPGADENLQKDMTIFVAACDRLRERFEATVIGVHHTNKNGDMRGSTVFVGQGDFIFRVDKDDNGGTGVLTCEKQKEAEDGWKVAFSVEKQCWLPAGSLAEVSSLTVSFGGAPEEVDATTKWPSRDVCRDVLRALHAAWDEGRPWSPHSRSQTEGRFAVRNISQAFGIGSGVVSMMLGEWQRTGIVGLEVFDKHSKSRGLRVLKWLD